MKPNPKEPEPRALNANPKARKAKPRPRAQAAMEYLMTYGWTLLVVAIIGAALVAFTIPGVPSTRCIGFDRLHCIDNGLTADGEFAVVLQNGTGAPITVDSVVFSGDVTGPGTAEPSTVASGDSFMVSGAGTPSLGGSDYEVVTNITYTKGTGLTITEEASCGGKQSVTGIPLGNATGSGYINCGDKWCVQTAIVHGMEYAREHGCPVIEMADMDGDEIIAANDLVRLNGLLVQLGIDCSTL